MRTESVVRAGKSDRRELVAPPPALYAAQQRRLRRPLPTVPWMAMVAACQFAQQVGGDLVDVRRHGMRVAAAVADVCGHGARAARLAEVVAGWLDRVPDRFTSPMTVVAALNRRLCACLPDELFVTLAYVVVDARTGEAWAAVAGHEPPLVRRSSAAGPGARIELLPVTGPALGLIADARFDETRFALAGGDLLLLYTDGLTTARTPEGGRTGLVPATDILERPGEVDLDHLVESLQAAARPGGAEPEDDLALLALYRRPTALGAFRRPPTRCWSGASAAEDP
jgi:sigma-B regulation protein RsbU (phosphoserine phosphatase)